MMCARKSDQKITRKRVDLSQEEKAILKVQPGGKDVMKGKNM